MSASRRAAAESAEDRALIDASIDMPLVPGEVAERIFDGENPVRVWREHRNLTQVALAAKAGVSPTYLSKIERGKRSGTTKVLRALADALGVDLDHLA